MSYTGGKGAEGTAQRIINEQPPHSCYIEPFAGHAAVLRAKRPARENICIEIELGANAWLRLNSPPGTTVILGDGIPWLARETFTHDTLIYCDPPYPIESRKSQRSRYQHELTTADHAVLLGILLRLPCMVQISSYGNAPYFEALRGWRHITFQSTTRRGLATEHLWMNYPPARALHTYTHLGADYRERERIKRKAARWTRRIESLPPLERLAVFSAINERNSGPPTLHVAQNTASIDPPATPRVAVLFAHHNSPYKAIPACDVYDRQRDALKWRGGCAAIAHPPCAQWGRFATQAKNNPTEKELGLWAVTQVRRHGGILEHPVDSKLWVAAGLPAPGHADAHGGYTLTVNQCDWGHAALKRTWLYICGCPAQLLPPMPPAGRQPTAKIAGSKARGSPLPGLSHNKRELTPPEFAAWLVLTAQRCTPPAAQASA